MGCRNFVVLYCSIENHLASLLLLIKTTTTLEYSDFLFVNVAKKKKLKFIFRLSKFYVLVKKNYLKKV